MPLINATAPDARFIYEAVDAAKSLLSTFNNFVDPQTLTYMPSSYYLFIIYSAVFLYKVSPLAYPFFFSDPLTSLWFERSSNTLTGTIHYHHDRRRTPLRPPHDPPNHRAPAKSLRRRKPHGLSLRPPSATPLAQTTKTLQTESESAESKHYRSAPQSAESQRPPFIFPKSESTAELRSE